MIDEPILVVTCHEPEGAVERSVRPMKLTLENLRIFWEKARQFKYLFDSEINDDFAKFCRLFLQEGPNGVESKGLFWVVDDFVGVIYMNRIVVGVDALVHYTFFDRRHRGRHELIREMIRYGFRKYNFRRLSVEVPMYAQRATQQFVLHLGFIEEGRKRKLAWHNDDWFDVKLFSILKEEALNLGDQ